jgi:hypothetical protein
MIAEEGKAERNIGERWSAILVPSPAASNRHLVGSRKPFPVEYLTDARETLWQFVERR